MTLTDTERAGIIQILDEYCDQRVSIMARDEAVLQYRMYRNDVLLFEKRSVSGLPGNWIEHGVAKFRLNRKTGKWSLLCSDRNGKWSNYEPCHPSSDITDLLREVDADPTAVFWG